nr:transmembrane protein C17orf113 homolog isoform X2 [Geotrypetes seraphini]
MGIFPPSSSIKIGNPIYDPLQGSNMVPPGKKPAGETSNSNKKCKRYFNEHWKEEFSWLEFDYERKLMFCVECRQALVKNKHGKAENAFTVGTDNFQRHALLRHVTSGAHRQALMVNKEQLAFESRLLSRQEPKSVIKVEVSPSKVALLTSVYWMAKEEILDEKYQSLLELQRFNFCQALLMSELHEYYHPSSVKEMQAAIVKVLHNEDRHRMRASPFVGLLVDETVDIAEHRNLVMFTTTVSPSDGQISVTFLGIFELPVGESCKVADKAVEVMHSFGVPTIKITWLGSDGSALMTDQLNGVGTKLKCICPLLTEMHCMSHRSFLFPSENISLTEYLKRYETTVDAIYRIYSNFKGERYSFQELQNVLISCNINLNSPKTVHWTSILKAVETIDSSWPTLVLLLESESEKSPVALGLCEELKKFQFVALTKVLLDILPIFQKLTQFFHIEDLDLSLVKPIITASLTTLQAQKKNSGQNFQEFLSEMNEHPGEEDDDRFRYKGVELEQCSKAHLKIFEQVKESYLDRAYTNLQSRFPNDVLDVVDSLAVIFNPKSYPQSLDDLGSYGDEEMNFLLRYYSHVVVCDRAIDDFPLFKRIVFSLNQLTCRELCVKLVYTNSEMHELFPDFAVLAAVVLALPLGTVINEKINRVKKLMQRNQCHYLKESLSNVIKIAVDGPSIDEFDFGLAIEYFERMRV